MAAGSAVCRLGGTTAWANLSDFVIDLRKDILREVMGHVSGPHNKDYLPHAPFATFLKHTGSNEYSYFDKNVLPKVLYRLKVNTTLLKSTVESQKP